MADCFSDSGTMSAKTDEHNIRFNGRAVNPTCPVGESGGVRRDPRDTLPDVRDGLTRPERILLHTLHRLEQERGGRSVPSALLYGHVVEHLDIGPDEFQELLTRLVGRRVP